jgi:hypothetical protein
VLLCKKRAPLTSSLVERECAVVAFKHWRFAARGRPVAHDACVVVAWKHWRFLCVEMAAKSKKAEALRLTFERRRFVKIKWEDETVNRLNRRAYDLEARRKRLDELYGLDPESKYGSAARAAADAETRKKETDDDARRSPRRARSASIAVFSRRGFGFGSGRRRTDSRSLSTKKKVRGMTAHTFP